MKQTVIIVHTLSLATPYETQIKIVQVKNEALNAFQKLLAKKGNGCQIVNYHCSPPRKKLIGLLNIEQTLVVEWTGQAPSIKDKYHFRSRTLQEY